MKEINYKEIFNDGNNKLLYSFEMAGNGYYYYYILFENNNFKAKERHSYYVSDLKQFINDIENLNLRQDLDINLSISDYDSGDFISFKKLDNLGHFELKGIIGGTFRDCYLNFKCKVDQTALIILVDYFKKNL